jgi:hypothetical protein
VWLPWFSSGGKVTQRIDRVREAWAIKLCTTQLKMWVPRNGKLHHLATNRSVSDAIVHLVRWSRSGHEEDAIKLQ